jgi:hypothetical protein
VPDGAEQNGVGLEANLQGFGGQRVAVAINSYGAYIGVGVPKGMAEARCNSVEYRYGLCGNFRPDAVAGQNSKMEVHGATVWAAG